MSRLANRNLRARDVDWLSPISAPTRFAARLQARGRASPVVPSAATGVVLPAPGRSESSSAWDIACIVVASFSRSYGPRSEPFVGVGPAHFPTCARGDPPAPARNIPTDRRHRNGVAERTWTDRER